MKTIEYKTHDKSSWGPGPWQDEPDKMQWQDEATGLPCLIVRNHFGALCGYVGVVEGHKFFEKSYDDVDVDVHGGLTFADFCTKDGDVSRQICHVPAPGASDHVWWLGFDCGHYMDLSPAMVAREFEMGWDPFPGVSYKDIAYVRMEVTQLADQLRDKV